MARKKRIIMLMANKKTSKSNSINFSYPWFGNHFVALSINSLVVLIIVILLPISSQCPEYYTQAQVNASGCSVGADIGAGIVAFFLVLILFIGLLGSFLTTKGRMKTFSLIATVALLLGLPLAWYFYQNRTAELYCFEQIITGTPSNSNDEELCKKYLQ